MEDHHELSDRGKIILRPTKQQLVHIQRNPAPECGRPIDDIVEDIREIFSYRFSTGHPQFFAFVPSPVSTLSWLGDAISSAFNSYAGSSESGAGVSAIEDSLIAWIAESFGLPTSASG